jgi:hypothetical protein
MPVPPTLDRSSPLTRGLVFCMVGGWPVDLCTGNVGRYVGGPRVGHTRIGNGYESTVTDGTQYMVFPDRLVRSRITQQYSFLYAADLDTISDDANIISIPWDGAIAEPYHSLTFCDDGTSHDVCVRHAAAATRQQYNPGTTGYWVTGYHTYAATRRGANIGIYKDGASSASTTGANAGDVDFSGSATELCVNAFSSTNPSSQYDGRFPILAIWARELSASEVKALNADPLCFIRTRGGPRVPPFVVPAGGTNTPQAAAGTVTPTGSLLKLALKALAGTVTPAGAETRNTNKPLAGSVTPSGSLVAVKVKTQSAAGTVTPTGSLVKLALKALAGTVTPTGSQTRNVGKVLAGGVTPTGIETRKTLKTSAGSVTPTGALGAIKGIGQACAGTIAPSGSLTRAISKLVAGTITPAGTQTRKTSKLVAGATSSSGTCAKSTGKRPDGTVTPTSTLGAVFIPAGGTVTYLGTGTLTLSGPSAALTQTGPTGTLTISYPDGEVTIEP